MRKTIAATVIVAAAVIGITTACDPTDLSVPAGPTAAATDVRLADTTADVSNLTSSQENAVDKASDYLDYSSFSRDGLIRQLEFEGFANADATFAADYLNIDWNEQSVEKAKEYMDYSSFSQQALTDQLVFEGFTQAQAEHGAASQF
ncbi:Ltp family lipoprotein [Gordonia sp. HY285]|uniref:Ltp family lipoprotein n=1 Tax=Gordonia liuliyuniae TaxID=2911517 RepID=UPI001F26C94D|nr:Ltp family lipoprotein [Gordonia liuliyuniae]MCF8610043.1 Ltp family lipoprotein [Gordonia liuliyuniae]